MISIINIRRYYYMLLFYICPSYTPNIQLNKLLKIFSNFSYFLINQNPEFEKRKENSLLLGKFFITIYTKKIYLQLLFFFIMIIFF